MCRFRCRHRKGGLVVMAATLFLAGCGHLPVTSMIKLARLDNGTRITLVIGPR